MSNLFQIRVFLILCFSTTVLSRIHKLKIEGDSRAAFPISTFGFKKGGTLAINLVNFFIDVTEKSGYDGKHRSIGFSLHKSEAYNPYLEHESTGMDFLSGSNECYLERKPLPGIGGDEGLIFFTLNRESLKLDITCSSTIENLRIEPAVSSPDDPTNISKASTVKIEQSSVKAPEGSPEVEPSPSQGKVEDGMRKKREIEMGTQCKNADIKLFKTTVNSVDYYNTSLFITIETPDQEGLYMLFYHNCYNSDYRDLMTNSNFAIYVVEKNGASFLSAGEMPLPTIFLSLALLFLFSAIFWTFVLRRNGSELVYRIHWIMAALIYLKSLSLFFHGIDYHKIETYGYHIESWAVLYYITHLLKGALLFFTIVLIGSGWAFIKHILTDREKRVFMIILPLQVLANVAYIIIEESEEGEIRRNWWKEVFILVDLLCCGAILFPVVWSIRHLQEASQTDGKATISLEKLKLFRHFYIMVVIYIYFTRIIVYLLKITVPYKYEWLDDVFKEAATFIFFFMTGYKFRPASNNPYFALRTDDYELEEEVISAKAIDEIVVKRKNPSKYATGGDTDDSEDSDSAVFFPDKKENSHELGLRQKR